MNLRRSQLAEEIIDGLDVIDIPDESLLIVNLPSGLDSITTRNIGESITTALKALGKNNPILLMPKDIKLSALSELDMKELGYTRTTPPKTPDANLYKLEPCDPIASQYSNKTDNIWTTWEKLPSYGIPTGSGRYGHPVRPSDGPRIVPTNYMIV